MWIRGLLGTLIGLFCFSLEAKDITSSNEMMVSQDTFQFLRTQPEKWSRLYKRCNSELSVETHAVGDYSPARHYTADGVSHDPSAKFLITDAGVAYRSALCYQLTHEGSFASHTQAIADAWGKTLKYVSKDQGAAEINFNMPQLIIAASWVKHVNQWNDDAFRSMLKSVAAPLSHSDRANNHGNWGVLLDASIADYLDDKVAFEKAKIRWQDLLINQVAADGSLPLEICRSNTSNYCSGSDKGINGLSYTHYSLYPTTIAAEIFFQHGYDLYRTAAGKKLEVAFRQAAAWTLHPDSFPYFVSNHGQLAGVRNVAYFSILQNRFYDQNAEDVISQGNLGMNGFELTLLAEVYTAHHK